MANMEKLKKLFCKVQTRREQRNDDDDTKYTEALKFDEYRVFSRDSLKGDEEWCSTVHTICLQTVQL